MLTSEKANQKLKEVIKQLIIESPTPITRTEIIVRLAQLDINKAINELSNDKIIESVLDNERQQNVYTVKEWKSLNESVVH